MDRNLHLLLLPHVVQNHIMSFMTIPELLKMRCVCKSLRGWVDRVESRLAEHLPMTVVLHRGGSTFTRFCFAKSQPPHLISKVYLESDTLDVYEDKAMSQFLDDYSDSITELRLKRYFICSRNEKQALFLEALTNLESLEVEQVWLANEDNGKGKIPGNFGNLTNLKLGQVLPYEVETYEAISVVGDIPLERRKQMRWYTWDVLDSCNRLKFLRIPFSPKAFFDNTFDECFRLLNYIRIRTFQIPERRFRSREHLMQCDINGFNSCTSSLEILLIIGARMRIQFLNVNSKIFKRGSSFCVVGIPQGARRDYIYSFMSTSLVTRSFDFLHKITIKASLIQNECIIGREKGPELFPNLKEIDIILDIGFDTQIPQALYSQGRGAGNGNEGQRNVCFPRADQVLKFFFPENLKYKQVHTLSITFAQPVFENQRRAGPGRLGTLPVIIDCLPNVRKLWISGWNGKRETFFKLWSGFSRLKTLIIERCNTLNASCFIDGNGNPNNPSNFQFLPELELLELRGLNDMPGITNRTGLGMDVFRRMGLQPFKLLTKQIHEQTAVWIRPVSSTGPPSLENSLIVTRSISRSRKRPKK